MPVIGSVDLFMRLIWQTTLALVAVGLVLITGLVLHRLLEEWREKRHRPARDALRRRLLASLNAPVAGESSATDGAAAPRQSLARGLPLAATARLVDELAQIVRGEARLQLAAFAAATGVERYWLKRLGSRGTRYRQEALRCLALLATERTVGALQDCLASGDDRLRLSAAEALAHHPTLAGDLVSRMMGDPAAGLRPATRFWHRIAEVAPESLIAHLDAAAARPPLLCRLIEALADAGHVAAAGPIEACLGEAGEAVDRAILAALQRLRHPAMLRVARRLARAADPATRRAALAVLKGRARPADLELIESLAADPIADIRTAAATTLARLGQATTEGAVPG